MAFVPGYEHDIFVSYAHVDDQPFSGVDEGWVTTLIGDLKKCLGMSLGRADAYSLWMDHQLSRHVQITPEILNTLQKTATIVVMLSLGYLASEWCLREKDTFLRMIQERARSGSRTFIIERDKREESECPPEFHEIPGYHF